jgi:hypothetical protein
MLIAGVRINTVWHQLTPRPEPNRAYEEFLADSDSSLEPPDIKVEVHPLSDAPTHPSGDTKIFDSEQSWSLFRDGTHYLLSLAPPFHNQDPVWLARFDSPVSRVDVFLNASDGVMPDHPVRYPLDQFLLVCHLATRSGLILHAAGATFGSAGLVFAGRSRAGKSTLCRQLQSDRRIDLLSDDRIIVRDIDGVFRAFGTPWPGEAGIAKNTSAPMKCLFFLSHGAENRVEPINRQEALANLLPIASIPWYEKHLVSHALNTCDKLLNRIPAYNLCFRPDSSVAGALNDFVNQKNLA